MAAPTTIAEANEQAIVETLAAARFGGMVHNPNAIAQAQILVTGDSWSDDQWVYESGDTAWENLFASAPSNVSVPVYYNRSGPIAAPYGGGWAGDQYED